MTINKLKNMLTNIGLNVESEKLSKVEVQLFPTDQPLKDNTVLEGYSCNIKNWPKFKVWINKSNKVTIKSRGVQKSFDIEDEKSLREELKGFEIL
ncbi:hypothetical protein L4932_03475 [Staphylococcus aureus]|uniref:hypothetical protein n=1 Tax=Staphylococcus aureus TaxID=1280 RepID=UPI001F5BDC9F|nr:hypothetical protein [Staphylococcus aureus]MDN4117300.1 hypothetical protein [Staphylococcus aureus]MDN4124256.1 hypothetical protein [Staphylococcus aureus]